MEDILGSVNDRGAQAFGTIQGTAAPEWVMLGLALLMFGGWSATYIATIRKAKRDRTYGIPVLNTCLNFSWELTFSLNLLGGLPKFIFPLQLGHLLWLIPNSINVFQTWKYGADIEKNPWVKRHFRLVLVLTLPLAFFLLYTFHRYTRDVYGVASSWIINVMMSWLFIKMLNDRRNDIAADRTIRGLSLPAAVFKLIGNGAGALFCLLWWPGQFAAIPNRVIQHGDIAVSEPVSYAFLNLV